MAKDLPNDDDEVHSSTYQMTKSELICDCSKENPSLHDMYLDNKRLEVIKSTFMDIIMASKGVVVHSKHFEDSTELHDELDQRKDNLRQFQAKSGTHSFDLQKDLREKEKKTNVRLTRSKSFVEGEIKIMETVIDEALDNIHSENSNSDGIEIQSLCSNTPNLLVKVHVIISADTEICIPESITIEADNTSLLEGESLTTFYELLNENANLLSFKQVDEDKKSEKCASMDNTSESIKAIGQFVSISDGKIYGENSNQADSIVGGRHDLDTSFFEPPSFASLIESPSKEQHPVSSVNAQHQLPTISSPLSSQTKADDVDDEFVFQTPPFVTVSTVKLRRGGGSTRPLKSLKSLLGPSFDKEKETSKEGVEPPLSGLSFGKHFKRRHINVMMCMGPFLCGKRSSRFRDIYRG